MSRVRTWLGDPVAAGATAGALLSVVEIVRLGALSRPSLALSAAGVLVVAGALCGAAIAVALAVSDRLLPGATGARRWARAGVLALPTVAVTLPVGGSLFQGAFAATLPGARWAPIAVPVIVWLLTAAAIALVGAAEARARRLRAVRMVVVGLLIAGTIVVEGANRLLFRSGYPAVHLGLALAALGMLGIAIRAAATREDAAIRAAATREDAAIRVAATREDAAFRSAATRATRRMRMVTAGVMAVLTVAVAALALRVAADRTRVATHGDDVKHLARAAREMVDLDGDGSSAILGGGDCDDGDGRRHAGAADRPGNGVDEDCDGVDAVPPPAPVVDVRRDESLAAWRARPEVAARFERMKGANLLIVSVDALRADHLAVGDPVVPRLGGLLAESVAFAHALAPGAGTDVSLATIATGRWNPFQPIEKTLAEVLADSGRVTHAILPREVLRYAGETLLTRGWQSVDRIVTDGTQRDVGDRVTAATTTTRAIEQLERVGDRPFVLWAHYFDIHEHAQIDVPAELMGAVTPGLGPIDHRYRALLHGVDREVGRLLDAVAAKGLAEETIVMVFSDHGESLGEDPRLPDRHGLVVYHALTHVPLFVKVPGATPQVIEGAVSLVDVPPTLIGLLGLPADAMGALDGVDLAPAVMGAPRELVARERTLVLHEQEQWAVVAWPWKLLVRPADNLTELYDLSKDPGEKQDLAAREPARVTELRGRYGWFPEVPMDRTQAGRRWRERQAQPPRGPRPPSR